ncbi:collagenase-like protease [Candidatus Pacearchaeota archaeon]|nr:collagenase-like protease [Candidatus Pacearchaeota archaeon]
MVSGNKNQIEIMAPAGSYESLEAGIKAGCDSVYFGIEQLNMRARASNNFTLTDLRRIVERCNKDNVKTYLTLNTILYDHDINLMKKICDAAKESEVSAVIASDVAVISYANLIGLEVHISTQVNVSNIETVRFYSKFADVIVLARELTLQQIKDICEDIKREEIKGPSGELVRIEIFAHGALCVAISGKCYMSLATENASANRGACLQNCRKAYRVIDEESGEELKVDNKYIMSPKDLCTIGFLDKLLDSGICVLKLEGRGRSVDYVHTVTKTYREGVDSVFDGSYNSEKIEKWIKDLESVYNRGFWHGGYYLGKKLGEWSGVYGSKSSKEKRLIGVCKHYYPKTEIGEFLLTSGKIEIGDEIIVTGKSTGILKQKIEGMYVDEKPANGAEKGDVVTMKVSERVRENDKLFILVDKEKYQDQKGKIVEGD